MTIVLISDIHYGDQYYINGELTNNIYSERYLNGFIQDVEKIAPDFIIQMGDLITSVHYEEDLKQLKEVSAKISNIPFPMYHILGNHDAKNIHPSHWEILMNQSNMFFNILHKNHNFIFLNTNSSSKSYPFLEEEQIEWLKSTLETIKGPVFIFGHHSLYKCNLDTNYWFRDLPEEAYVKNYLDVSEVLVTHKTKIKAVFNGHLHTERFENHYGIDFHSLNAFIENATGETPEYKPSYYVLNVEENLDNGYSITPINHFKYNEQNY